MISMEKWLGYEDKFREIVSKNLDDFGLTSVVEAKQDFEGEITSWNIDVSGYDGENLVVYECRNRKRKPIKGDLGEFAFRLSDLDARGFIVSPKGLTAGAQEIASAKGIEHIPFSFDVNTGDFVLRIKTKILAGLSNTLNVGHSGKVEILRSDGTKSEIELDPNS
jgi:hypothetical protein